MAEISNLRKQYLSEIGHSVDVALEPVENYDGLKGVSTNRPVISQCPVVVSFP